VLATAVAALLVGAPAASYDVSVRAELGRSRLDPKAEGLEVTQRTSAELSLSGGVVLDSQRWSARLDYAPRLWTPKLSVGDDPNLDHRLLLRGYFRPSASWNAGLALVGTRGVLDPLADAWTDYAPDGAVFPNDKPQPYESGRLAADVTIRAGARTLVVLTGTAGVSQGRDPTARLLLPRQGALTGSAVIGYTAGARDQFSLLAEANANRTCPQECPDGLLTPKPPAVPEAGHPFVAESVFGLAGLRWEHDLSPGVRTLITAGASYVRETNQGSDTVVQGAAPGGELGLTRRADRGGLSGDLTLRYAPAIDRATGRIRQTASASGVVGWIASPLWTWGAGLYAGAALDKEKELTAGAAGGLREPGDPRSWGAQAYGVRRLDNGVEVQFGLRWRWQKDTRSVQGSFTEAGLFLAVDWALARARPPQVQPQQAQGAPARG